MEEIPLVIDSFRLSDGRPCQSVRIKPVQADIFEVCKGRLGRFFTDKKRAYRKRITCSFRLRNKTVTVMWFSGRISHGKNNKTIVILEFFPSQENGVFL